MATLNVPAKGASYVSYGELAVSITQLDTSYDKSGRTVLWRCRNITDGGSWKNHDEVDLGAKKSSISYTFENLVEGAEYEVEAIIDNIERLNSSTNKIEYYSVTLTSDNTYYAATECYDVSVGSVDTSDWTIKASWSCDCHDDTLEHFIYNLTDSEGNTIISGDTTTRTYVWLDVEPDTKYTFSVRPVLDWNGTEDWHNVGSVTFTTPEKLLAITAKAYIQNANGSYPSSTSYTYSYNMKYNYGYDVEDFGADVFADLKDDITTKLAANLNFAYVKDSYGNSASSGTIYFNNDGTISVYFSRTTYYMTLAATEGVGNFTINNVSFNIGEKLSFLYEQSITIKANLSNNYEFTKWTANSTSITTVHNKTSNPLTFTMPASDFTITANATWKTVYYNVNVYCYYELADSGGFTGGYVDSFDYASGTTFIISDYKNDYLKTGFYFWKAQDEDTNEIQTSITITEDTDIEFYYKRNVWVLTLKGGTGVSSFTVNGNTGYASGSTLSYKYEQTVKIQAIFKDNYSLDYWSSSQFSGLSGNPITINMPNSAATITVYAKVGIVDWEWKDYEIEAFEGQGAFSTLTAERWNEFLDWCNEVLTFKGKTTIGSAYYGERNQPLYASDFNYIIDRLEAVATISSDISSTKVKGDIIKGSYFIDIANAMNNVL